MGPTTAVRRSMSARKMISLTLATPGVAGEAAASSCTRRGGRGGVTPFAEVGATGRRREGKGALPQEPDAGGWLGPPGCCGSERVAGIRRDYGNDGGPRHLSTQKAAGVLPGRAGGQGQAARALVAGMPTVRGTTTAGA